MEGLLARKESVPRRGGMLSLKHKDTLPASDTELCSEVDWLESVFFPLRIPVSARVPVSKHRIAPLTSAQTTVFSEESQIAVQ